MSAPSSAPPANSRTPRLRRQRPCGRRGRRVRYGKTHLTVELLRWIEGHGEDATHTLYVDAPSDTFQALYKDRFFPKLDKDDVRRRVTEYYADVVAEELADSP
ncbi:hypothetical protein ACFQ60_01130 [Streptomyces zhihengii]